MTVSTELREEIQGAGPISFERLVDTALYHPTCGFYATVGSAGRRGDFITSPEVGPLFGAVIAKALDRWWDGLGSPEVFRVVEAGAGPGTLARAIALARPACSAALDYTMVELSLSQREQHPVSASGITFRTAPVWPENGSAHVALANELLDNLPCRIAELTSTGWQEIVLDLTATNGFVEQHGPLDDDEVEMLTALVPRAAVGDRCPIASRAAAWVNETRERADRVVVFDYGAPTATLVERGEWLRTYRNHDRGVSAYEDLGSQDITYDVPVDQLPAADQFSNQRDWLQRHGIDDLVTEAKAVWSERAAIGDLAAIKARSAIGEAEALTDPAGLGSFWVAEWVG